MIENDKLQEAARKIGEAAGLLYEWCEEQINAVAKAIEDLSISGGVSIDNATEAMIMALRAFNQGIKPFKNPPEGKSNNWLKMHGFHMRRKAGKRRIKL